MAYNEKLTERIRSQLEGLPFVEKKMFGGVGFLFNGNMARGVNRDDLVVRVEPEGCKTEKQPGSWVRQGVEFASTLPPKQGSLE